MSHPASQAPGEADPTESGAAPQFAAYIVRVLQVAKECAALGLPVFSLAYRSKRPDNRRGWQERARTDPAMVDLTFSHKQPENLGIATGRGMVFVLDVDPGKGGFESLERLEDRYTWHINGELVVEWRGVHGWEITVALPKGSEPGHIGCVLRFGRGCDLDLWGLLQQPDHPGLRRLLESLGPLGGDSRIPSYREPEPGSLRHRVEGLLDQLGEHHEHYGDYEDGTLRWVLDEQRCEILRLLIGGDEVLVNLTALPLGYESLTVAELPLAELNLESLRQLLERGRYYARWLLEGKS